MVDDIEFKALDKISKLSKDTKFKIGGLMSLLGAIGFKCGINTNNKTLKQIICISSPILFLYGLGVMYGNMNYEDKLKFKIGLAEFNYRFSKCFT